MISLTTTIQEITLQAYAFGVYGYLFNREHNDMSRDEILNLFEEWGKEFECIATKHADDTDWYYYDEIDNFIQDKFLKIRLEDMFPAGIAVGDYLSYEGGVYEITGFTDRGILVSEKVPPVDAEYITVEIGFSQADKVKVVEYEEIMNTTNGHDPELVCKINQAWNEKREKFCPILRALYMRDIDEIFNSDAFNWTNEIESVKEYLWDKWDYNADNYLQHIADDTDLKTILTFLRYEV